MKLLFVDPKTSFSDQYSRPKDRASKGKTMKRNLKTRILAILMTFGMLLTCIPESARDSPFLRNACKSRGKGAVSCMSPVIK